MEQMTLVFLIGAFALFLINLKIKNEMSLKILGLLSSVCLIALSITDPTITTDGEMTVMLVSGFAFVMYSLLGIVKGA